MMNVNKNLFSTSEKARSVLPDVFIDANDLCGPDRVFAKNDLSLSPRLIADSPPSD